MELLVNLLGVSRNLERIADHAVNISEDVIYLARGDIPAPWPPPDESRRSGRSGKLAAHLRRRVEHSLSSSFKAILISGIMHTT